MRASFNLGVKLQAFILLALQPFLCCLRMENMPYSFQ